MRASVARVARDEFGAPVIRVVDGHEIRVSNPTKPYFPGATGGAVTKLDVIDYYTEVGDAHDHGVARPADDLGALARGSGARRAAEHA